jgi:hypothetical protein
MIAEVSLFAALLLPATIPGAVCDVTPPSPGPLPAMLATAPDDDLRDLYLSGEGFEKFLGDAERRRELWHGNWGKSEGIDMAMVERAREVGGTWHFLVVAIDSCSDSVSTIPYLARLVSMADNLNMRVVDPDAGVEIMRSHRTPDGRPSTPTVVLLDENFDEAGCFIERPTWLRDHIIENPDDLGRSEIVSMKMEWYSDNAGADTVTDFVTMLEAAGRGEVQCASSGA